jgi:hypothetical protein
VGTHRGEGLLALCQGMIWGDSFVVEGNVEIGDGFADGGVAITPDPDWFDGLWVRQQKGRTSVVRDLRTVEYTDVTLTPSNAFRFTFDDSHVTGELNGREVFPATDASHGFHELKTMVGVGGQWGQAGSKVRFTKLRIKKLDEAKP